MTQSCSSKRTLLLLFALFAIAMAATPAMAQKGFLKIDGIDGEAKGGHNGWIDVLSVSYVWEKPGGGATGQSRRRGSVTYGDLVIVKEIDASTPKLIDSLSKGIVSKGGSIDLMRGNSVVLKYELTNVVITSHSMKDGKEQLTLGFEGATITHPASRGQATVSTN